MRATAIAARNSTAHQDIKASNATEANRNNKVNNDEAAVVAEAVAVITVAVSEEIVPPASAVGEDKTVSRLRGVRSSQPAAQALYCAECRWSLPKSY
jgi:hypothetical protein